MENFDFDEWSALAQSAPDEFESRRHRVIERVIACSGDTHRLRGLQCRIDLERVRARTPMKACIRLSSLMWDSFFECRDRLNALAYHTARHSTPLPPKARTQAKILPFARRSRH